MPTPPKKKRSGKGADTERDVQSPSVRDVRETARRVTRISELYGAGETGRLLDGRFTKSPKIRRVLQRRHKRATRGIGEDGVYRWNDHEWKVPGGVRISIKKPLIWAQVVNQYPWAVVWTSPNDGHRKRKLFATAGGGIHFIATQAQYVDKRAALVSRVVGYDIPIGYVNKIPRPWRWCPYCMTLRKFKRKRDGSTFYGERKEWSHEKARYEWRSRRLAVLECVRCGCTNKDPRMRRSNQPWEKRVIRQGARRVRRRK